VSSRIANGEVTQERLDELALGKLNPKTGKRKGGFIGAVRSMKQTQEKLSIGELDEDDLIEQAYRQAWNYLKREAAQAGGDVDTFEEEDAEYARVQEARYREEYDWDDSNANDDAALTNLISLEVESRRLKRDLQRPNIPWKEKTGLLDQLRQLALTHANIQKSLQIDKATRENRRRSDDPMDALKREIQSGAEKMRALIEEWSAVAPTASNMEELRALIKHHSGLPYAWIDVTIAEVQRLSPTVQS
jgi:hypothetical protein